MNLLLVGLNHRTAPVQVREQLAIPLRELDEALASLHATPDVTEAVILFTCNRVELYVAGHHPSAILPQLVDFLASRGPVIPPTFQSSLYDVMDTEAIAHLFRVTAGLDSMILGEPEIATQVKQAYLAAQTHGTTGPVLNRLFQKALHAAKVIRSNTRLGVGQASIGSVVVSLARTRFGDRLRQCEVLLWGAGKAAESTARHLITTGVGRLWIVNRTPLKAQDLATLCQSGWLSWEQALQHLAHVDIAVVCTQAPHYVIDRGDLDGIASGRGSRPLLLIDLAVPRNVDPALTEHPNIHLYNIDDLQSIAQTAVAQRQQELERCEALVQEQVRHFLRWRQPVLHQELMSCRSVESVSSV